MKMVIKKSSTYGIYTYNYLYICMYVLCIMHYVLCTMYYVLCIIYYVLCIMYYVYNYAIYLDLGDSLSECYMGSQELPMIFP